MNQDKFYSNPQAARAFITAMLEADIAGDRFNLQYDRGVTRRGPGLRNYLRLGVECMNPIGTEEACVRPTCLLELNNKAEKKVEPLSSLTIKTLVNGTVQHERITNRSHDELKRQFIDAVMETTFPFSIMYDWFEKILKADLHAHVILKTDTVDCGNSEPPLIPTKIVISSVFPEQNDVLTWIVDVTVPPGMTVGLQNKSETYRKTFDSVYQMFIDITKLFGFDFIRKKQLTLTKTFIEQVTQCGLVNLDKTVTLSTEAGQSNDYCMTLVAQPIMAEGAFVDFRQFSSTKGTLYISPFNSTAATAEGGIAQMLIYCGKLIEQVTKVLEQHFELDKTSDYDHAFGAILQCLAQTIGQDKK